MIDWDGSPLGEEVLIDLPLQLREPAMPVPVLPAELLPHAEALRELAKHAANASAPSLEQAIEKVRGGDHRRGILIEGPAGSGKSVLSQVLFDKLQRRLTDARVVRFGARELAQRLSSKEPSFSIGMEDGLLVAIVDGLDELDGSQHAHVLSWLEQEANWWLVTTRPLSPLRRIPEVWRFAVEELSWDQGRKLLCARGRADLAEQCFGVSLNHERLPAAITSSPLLLTLLARVVERGTSIRSFEVHGLYERLFHALLEQGITAGRLTDEAARRLRTLREQIVGEIALDWLQGAAPLDLPKVTQAIERAGFRGEGVVELVKAMEFGHLLVPVARGWDFAHRTIAEWVAAAAIRRRVSSRIAALSSESTSSNPRGMRAFIEDEELRGFLSEGIGPRSPWHQLLWFYASFLEESLSFLDTVAGIRGRQSAPPRVFEMRQRWDDAWHLVARVRRWSRAEDARAAWGIAVRCYLLDSSSPVSSANAAMLRQLALGVAPHLPRLMPELLALAARAPEQREMLEGNPLELLPALPASHEELVKGRIRGADPDTQRRLLEWHRSCGVAVDQHVLRELLSELARETSAEPKRQSLETLSWEAAIDSGFSSFWPVVRHRVSSAPYHLKEPIERWLALPREAEIREAMVEDGHRREAIASSLASVYQAERWLKVLHRSRLETVVGELFDSLVAGSPNWDRLVEAMVMADRVPVIAEAAVSARRKASAAASEAARVERDALAVLRRPRQTTPSEELAARFDDAPAEISELVAMVLELIGGDSHQVYGTPGALGSEYDEPSDLDWYSEDLNRGVVAAAKRRLEEALRLAPSRWRELRLLLSHPSQMIRIWAFEQCAERSSQAEIIALAIETLELHHRHDQTRMVGSMAGLLPLAFGAGAGEMHIDIPDVRQKLVEAVRRRLTPAHRDVVEALARQELPAQRALAAAWCRELGDASWLELVEPMLSDERDALVHQAATSVLALAPERLEMVVLAADRSRWTARHDVRILGLDMRWSPETLATLTREAGARVREEDRFTVFDGAPSPVEAAWPRAGNDLELSSAITDWQAHPDRRVRAVAMRLGVMRGEVLAEALVPLLASQDLFERAIGAEGLTRLSMASHLDAIILAWKTLFEPFSWAIRHELNVTPVGDRLLWALSGSSVEFAPLLSLVAHRVPFDHFDSSDTPEGERLVEQVVGIVKAWGDAGVEALLRLMDEQEVDDHYDFCGLVEARCRRDPDFRIEVQRRASTGNRASVFAMENLRRAEKGRDVDGFLAELRATVLPEDWLTLSACAPAEIVRRWRSALHFDEPTLARILAEEPERLHTRLDAWGFSTSQRSALERWFSNFTQDAHQRLAEKLFWHLDYYSSERFIETLKLRHQALLRMLAERGLGARRILLVTPGGVDSGQRHAYDLAKQWGLLHDQCCELSALSEQMTSERVVVWFNDTHGSGNQFLRDIWPKLSPLLSNAAAFVMVAVAMAREARARFQREIPEALLIPRENARTAAEVLTGEELRCAQEIGRKLDAKRPLGFGGTALLVAYYFQCPNNSLPLLWRQQDEGYPWSRLFAYYPKLS